MYPGRTPVERPRSNGYVQAAAELLGGAAALGPLAAERYLSVPACAVLRGVAVVSLTPNP